ncbi:MAG: 30S ribosomal protein S13 [Nanoarchaeota archaeon]|nr:30S ribosomal protein S13 [Nanoarchaeota archaeon]MBU1051428.1 30S ribosomal protein S13 [Nanoarchaeota archaeon]MBU1988075.1 30S ribosomal protein S13 [Nanoarchaeota archaeon]
MAAPNQPKTEKPKKHFEKEDLEEMLIRIAGYDIPGSKRILAGLTRIKGVGWTVANATCIKLKIQKTKKVLELSKEEIQKIEEFLKNPDIKDFQKNRRKDPETGETEHCIGADLEMKRDFDIRRMKKIKSYKGIRHTAGLPVRGQRTRSHFRKKGKAVSVQKKASKGKKG